MEIKDYLHLYLGCPVLTERGVETLISVGLLGSDSQRFRTLQPAMSFSHDWIESNRLIIRPLSSMTEEESNELERIGHQSIISQVSMIQFQAEKVKYMLSQGFDLFGLCDAGLAIDRVTTL